MRKRASIPVALAICWTGPVFAADKAVPLEEVVVTATRSEGKVRELPAKVEVIDSRDIALTPGATITEQLKKNSSVDVIEYPGVLAGIGIRGFRPETFGITKHSLVLINGRPAGATNLATILTDNIERIEVLKGPASSLYGGEAMGGVVNIITKKNTEGLTGLAEIGLGSFETNVQKVALGGEIHQRFDFDLAAGRHEQAGDFKMGNGETRANTSYQTRNGSLRLGTGLGSSWRFDMSGDLYRGRDIETPGDIFAGDLKSGHKDIDRYGLDFTVAGELGPDNRLSLTGYSTGERAENYSDYASDYSGWPVVTTVTVPTFQSYDSETGWLGLQLKDEYIWQGHRLIAGLDYQEIDKESRSYNQDGSRKAPYSPDEGRTNMACYLETVWQFYQNRLTATLGGRYDTFEVETKPTPYKNNFIPKSESFSTFSPRAGLNYLFDQGVRLHATVGKAFVPPSAWELAGYSQGTTGITRGNPDLDAESSLSCDFGLGYDQPTFGLSLDLTYFHTDVDDKITKVSSGGVTTYENSLSAEMAGFETMLSLDVGAALGWQSSLTLFVNGTHMLKAEEEQTDGTMKDIHNVAKYTVNYGVQYEDSRFDAKLNCRSVGHMKDTDWNAAGAPEITYPRFDVVDLVVGFNFLEQHRLALTVDNLFDENYYEKKGYPKPGRALFVSYRYSF